MNYKIMNFGSIQYVHFRPHVTIKFSKTNFLFDIMIQQKKNSSVSVTVVCINFTDNIYENPKKSENTKKKILLKSEH